MTLFSGFWLQAYQFLIIFTMLGALILVVGHAVTGKIFANAASKNVFFYSLAIALTFLFLSLRILFGDFPGRAVISFILVLALAAVVWWRTVIWFLGVYNRNKRKHEEPK